MVDFSFSEEERAVRRTARELAENEIAPVARHHEETGEWPREVWEKAVDAGLVGGPIPEEYGGAGLSQVEACLFAEELARVDAGMLAAIGTEFGTRMIREYGTEAQKEWILRGSPRATSSARSAIRNPRTGPTRPPSRRPPRRRETST
jgi:alkylation response protein AidB-like acyl-CoA dehydrogenase